MTIKGTFAAVCGITLAVVVGVRAQSLATPAELLKMSAVRAALDMARANESQTLADEIRFCEVPAPTFKEAARGEVVRQSFQQLGLRNVRVDRAGNVIGDRPGVSPRPRVVVSAHLDTVFPEGTNVTVKRAGTILRGPGIGDDCRGLAVLVAIARTFRDAGIQTSGSVTFAATVGEEGLGDLRGSKELFRATDIDRFVSIDGTGLGVTNVGVGSLRYRVTFKGPGGHSFAAFGVPSPIDAMGRAIARIADIQVPKRPATTFAVGRVGGGTSVNSIPTEAWMEVDLRSTEAGPLMALDAAVQRAVDQAVLDENERWGAPRTITVTKERVGERPAAKTPDDSPIVRTAEAVSHALGLPFTLHESSTDANVPMSLGIPAITIGGGGRGSDAHTIAESFDASDSWTGTARALLLTIALAQ
jgi:acetylornithine deacetylase/succinyl-diaminopimelate desuccinylase-like protein